VIDIKSDGGHFEFGQYGGHMWPLGKSWCFWKNLNQTSPLMP